MKLNLQSRIVSYILIVLIFVAFTSFSLLRREEETSAGFSFSNSGSVMLRESTGAQSVILYSDLLSVSYIEDANFGEPVTGRLEDGIREGVWRSETWGEYTASLPEEQPDCVLLRTKEGLFALGCATSAETRALYEALIKVMPDHGQSSDPAVP